MFGKKKNNKEKASFLEEKNALDDLYVAEMSIKTSGTVHSRETIICRCKKDSLGHPIYTDILTKNKYRLLDDYYAESGESIVFNPRGFTSVFKNGDYKDALLKQGHITKTQLISVYNALNDGIGYIVSKEEEKKQVVADSCTVLTEKNFPNQPILYREEELERLMISLALNKKIALVVGNYGSGTTSLIEYLAYLIKNKKCPEFLQQKNILEVNIPALQRKSNKKNTIEDRINAIIDSAKKTNSILFIDEADDITSPQTSENQNVLAMLRYAAERDGLKVIATSTKKRYEEYANSTEFKKQYDVISLPQLKEEELLNIINRKFNTSSKNNNISITSIQNQLPKISNILLETTSNNDTIMAINDENPGLVSSIIERSFAIAKAKKASSLELDYISKAILDTKQLNPSKVEKALRSIDELKVKEQDKQLRKQ